MTPEPFQSALPLLSLLVWLPIIGGLLTLALGNERANAARWFATAVAAATFALSILLFTGFDFSTAAMQFVEDKPWIPAFDIRYHFGVDGFSVPLIGLTALTSVLVLIGAWGVDKRVSQYYASFLILEGLMIGIFCALDSMLFYVFFECMLIPMFIIIGVWGGPRRVYAALKFFIYTFLGSVFMLIALIYLYMKGGSWQIADMVQLSLTATEQTWIFFGFLLGFAIKIPMFPVHTWLPDAHVEAPTAGSVILAAIMLKIGGYGFLRFALPIVPDAGAEWAWLLIALSLIAIVYVGMVALVQSDMKRLIAYSSVAHMGFVTLGTFLAFGLVRDFGNVDAARLGLQGAMVQMVSHGFISAALFISIGVLYDRLHTRRIADYGGVANLMPVFAFFYVLFAMANSGLPGTSAFVGEFMVILASFQKSPLIALLVALNLIISAGYSLWLVKRVLWGPVANDKVAAMKDLNGREYFVLGVFAVCTLLLGVWPKPLTDMMEPSIANLAMQIAASKL
ncbi:NADH-quinone oxidoreductase subunit M [Lysobacter sp. A03]|uniref:NADH-quinone oxidoreductase subunit M n=1 Tax=Lysobacter sp. A03 TaxID=1199154 RepID=UPI0005B6FC8E|nr:NADH-quinone oxidoreductase subunit M [Lysobacter sp. A03]KIQ98405.1 NADH-ubiquinone oxidoreductase chain M [Lysobacter sp. A03]